ncbi:hypothetical protein CJI97_002779 [Candidozyma auris]|nr:hypothetical protein CJI97_002779 [[Candida] auris]
MTSDSETKLQRPQLPHMKTTPDLVGGRYNPGIPNHTNEDRQRRFSSSVDLKTGPDALLAEVQNRSNQDYKAITFPPHKLDKTYQSRISFDTINIQYHENNDPLSDLSDDDIYGMRMRRASEDYDFNTRGRLMDSELKRPGARSPVASPSGSPTRMMSPHRNMASLFRGMVQYPTTPIITHRGTSFTRVHRLFEDLYLGNLGKQGIVPILPRRVILIYISGRQHTWVALDWILRNFIEHGDTVIIASAINHKLAPPAQGHTNFPSPKTYTPMTEKVRQRQRSRPEYIKSVALSVMNYALNVINKEIIAKVSVEIIDSHTKDALKDMYKLYEPNLVCVGSKVNTKNSAPLKSWQSSRLSDRLVKNFPIPVIVVPASNMGEFEKNLSEQMNREAEGDFSKEVSSEDPPIDPKIKKKPAKAVKEPVKNEEFENDADDDDDGDEDDIDSLLSDIESVESYSANSVSSSASYSSFKEICDIYKDYRLHLSEKLSDLKSKDIDADYFTNFAKVISDDSLQFCEDLRGIDPDFKGKGAKLASAITGSNSFGKVPYKTKSLLEPEISSNGPSTGKSYSELKKTLTRNAQNNEAMKNGSASAGTSVSPTPQVQFEHGPKIPSITIDDSSKPSKSPTPTQAPKHTALKFHNLETPSSYKERNGLKKFFSNDERSSHVDRIEPTKSNPELRSSSDDKKKKKKKKFWIF